LKEKIEFADVDAFVKVCYKEFVFLNINEGESEMARQSLHKGWMERNGIRACLEDNSYFGPGLRAVMHFDETCWHEYNGYSYPEVAAIACSTPVEDYCVPPDADYEIVRQDGGLVMIRIFAKQMPGSPVLEWIFPDPRIEIEALYKDFVFV